MFNNFLIFTMSKFYAIIVMKCFFLNDSYGRVLDLSLVKKINLTYLHSKLYLAASLNKKKLNIFL